jgi:DNA-binding NtrC family response regulator
MITKVLVVDDEPTIREIIKIELESHGYTVFTAEDVANAIKIHKTNYIDAFILDIRMPNIDGFYLLQNLRKNSKDIVIIMMTAYGTIDGAVLAMKMGANDYITKPFDNEELIEKLDQHIKIKAKKLKLLNPVKNEEHYLIGNSQLMQQIKNRILKVKDLDTTILITGESGTGKNVVAKEIHRLSNRNGQPFIHIDCAFLPPSLIESELFGHEKGAFTDALNMNKGKLELAGEGTIFLDEIGTLPLNLQSKLLNVLQERFIYRIGGSKKIPIKARIIAATNVNLETAVQDGDFREDLYYRLNVINIECPPLRYRKDDIIDLANHFLNLHINRTGNKINSIEEEVWKILYNYDWPGNIRELENSIESAVVLCEGTVISVEDLPIRVRKWNNKTYDEDVYTNELSLEAQEMMSIIRALENNDGHREKTAKELGISRRTLQYKLKKLNIG